jgi:hypothetical protein
MYSKACGQDVNKINSNYNGHILKDFNITLSIRSVLLERRVREFVTLFQELHSTKHHNVQWIQI